MTECQHPFAPCSGPCTSYNYRAAEITSKNRREIFRSSALRFAAMAAVALVLELGLLLAVVSIWQAGAENISNTIQANLEP